MKKKIITVLIILVLIAAIGAFIYYFNNSRDEDIKYEIISELSSDKIKFNKNKSGKEIVEYKGNYYLFIKMGEYSEGGHYIELQDIKVNGNNVVVSVKEKHPSATCTTTDAFTYPYIVVKFNKKPIVKVKRVSETYNCN